MTPEIRLSKLWPKINMKSLEIGGYDDYAFFNKNS